MDVIQSVITIEFGLFVCLTSRSVQSVADGICLVAESLEHGRHVWEIGSLIPSGVKAITYQMCTCHFLARHSVLIG